MRINRQGNERVHQADGVGASLFAIGYVLFEAVSNEDYPLMQGVFLIITAIVLIANFITDAVYVLLDPRTRDGG